MQSEDGESSSNESAAQQPDASTAERSSTLGNTPNAFHGYSGWLSLESLLALQASMPTLPAQLEATLLSNFNSQVQQQQQRQHLQQQQQQLQHQARQLQHQEQQLNLLQQMSLVGSPPQLRAYPHIPETAALQELQRFLATLHQLQPRVEPSIGEMAPPAAVHGDLEATQLSDFDSQLLQLLQLRHSQHQLQLQHQPSQPRHQEPQLTLLQLMSLVGSPPGPWNSGSSTVGPVSASTPSTGVTQLRAYQHIQETVLQELQRLLAHRHQLVAPSTGEMAPAATVHGDLSRLLASWTVGSVVGAIPAPSPGQQQVDASVATSTQLYAGRQAAFASSVPSATAAVPASEMVAALGARLQLVPQQAAANRNNNCQRTLPSSRSRRLIPIAMSTDHNSSLSEYQCLLREQILLFEADEEDVVCSRGRTKPVVVGQVGIVCKHCSQLPPRIRRRGASYFPATRVAVYGAAQHMAVKHLLDTCYQIPEDIRSTLASLKGIKTQSEGAGRQRWAYDLMEVGVVETTEGLTFGPDVERRAQHYSSETPTGGP